MTTPQQVMQTLIDGLESSFGPAPQAEPLRTTKGGGVRLLGSSVLDIQIREASENPPPIHELSETMRELVELGPLEHRGTGGDALRADLWRWSSARGDEELIELIATFAQGRERYRLELSSNSIDFQKGLGYELPAGLSWDALLEFVAEFIGAPSPAHWS